MAAIALEMGAGYFHKEDRKRKGLLPLLLPKGKMIVRARGLKTRRLIFLSMSLDHPVLAIYFIQYVGCCRKGSNHLFWKVFSNLNIRISHN